MNFDRRARQGSGDAHMTREPVIDLFAGPRPGGWDLAADALGMDVLGVELDDAACATRRAAGLRTVQADVAGLDPQAFVREHFGAALWGLIASAPCQAFSMAGKGAGRDAIPALLDWIRRMGEGHPLDVHELDKACEDPRAHLVLEPLRWAIELRPSWVALEQVEPVLPLWEAIGDVLRANGYAVWVGVVSAERYGVPQTRRRAVLLASLDRVVGMPEATHARYVAPRRRAEASMALFDAPEPERIVAPEDRALSPWVSMAQALGWTAWSPDDEVGFPRLAETASNRAGGDVREIDGVEYRERDLRAASEPSFVLTEKARSWVRFRANAQARACVRDADEPAPTITGGNDFNERVWEVPTALPGDALPTHLQAGTNDHDTARGVDEPANTLRFGERLNSVSWIVDTGNTRSGTRREGRARQAEEPAPVVTSRADQLEWRDAEPDTAAWTHDRPATTVAGDSRVFPPGHKLNADDERAGRGGQQRSGAGWTDGRPSTVVTGTQRSEDGGTVRPPNAERADGGQSAQAVRVTIDEAAVLQSFQPGYPWAGSKTKVFEQIGNAVPPLLALRCLEEVSGVRVATLTA